jgi:adenylate cyclase
MSTRRLAAILAADVAGFSAMMERDEEGTAARIRALRAEVIEPALARHQGRLVKTTGDGFLAEFASPVEAVRSALAIQDQLGAAESDQNPVQLRIGINLGDILIEEDGDVLGDGVNVAARLEQMAEAGGICISGKIHAEIEGKIDQPFEDRGEQQVKNIARPVRVFALHGVHSLRAQSNPLPPPDKPSIAVLPFTNMSGDPEQEYFADGVVEDIITALSRMKWFFVIARNSSFTYKDRAVDVRQVGRELGVRYIVEGSIRRAGGRLRITGQLIEAATGHHVWADRFDGSAEDVFDFQDRITCSIAGAIEPRLRAAEIERAKAKRTDNLQAYDLLLRALAELNVYDEQSLTKAEHLLRLALERDPRYSDAWAALATTAFLRQVGGWLLLDEARDLGVDAAVRAVRADPGNPAALSIAGAVLAYFGVDYDQAVEYAQSALRIDPNSAPVSLFCAFAFNFSGDFAQALRLLNKVRQTSPLDIREFIVFNQLTISYFFSHEFDEAIRWATRNVKQHPRFTPSRRFLAAALAHAGRIEEAHRAIQELLVLQPSSSLRRARTTAFKHPWMLDLYVEGLRKAGLT